MSDIHLFMAVLRAYVLIKQQIFTIKAEYCVVDFGNTNLQTDRKVTLDSFTILDNLPHLALVIH